MNQSSWLVAGMLPGIERHPRKKLEPSAERLLGLLHRWRDEAVRAGKKITRIALAFEAGRDGVWLARWLQAREVEAHVIHPSSVAVSREHRRAKTDRLDTELLKRSIYPIAPPAASSIDPGLIRRGAHLAALGYCDSCHTADRDRAYAVNRHRTRTPLNSVLSPCCDKKIPHLDGVRIGAERDPVSEANVRGFTAC